MSTVILDILYIFTCYVRTVIFAPTNYPKCIKIRNDTIIQTNLMMYIEVESNSKMYKDVTKHLLQTCT